MLARAWKFANRPLVATALGTLVATWLLAWRWVDVKPYLAPAWDAFTGWLAASAHVTHGGLVLWLALTAAVAALLGGGVIKWLRVQAANASVPADFNPTGIQLAAMGVLKTRYDCATPLGMLHQEVKILAANAGGMPYLARQMEDLERAHVARIEETGRTDRQYYLTPQGRDWLLDQIKLALEHPEGGPHEEAPKFDPDSFELTPARCRELLVLRDHIDERTSLHRLHRLVTDDGIYYDPNTSKAQVQHDMEAAERAGYVNIQRLPEAGLPNSYSLTVPSGRDWVLENEAHLKAGGRLGMKKKDLL